MSPFKDGFQNLKIRVEDLSDHLNESIDKIPVIGWLIRVLKFFSGFIVLLNQIPYIGPVIGSILAIAFLGPLVILEPVMSLLGLLVIPYKILSSGEVEPPPQFIPGGTSVVWLLYIEKATEIRMALPLLPIPWIWFAWILLGLFWILYLPFMWGIRLVSRLFHR